MIKPYICCSIIILLNLLVYWRIIYYGLIVDDYKRLDQKDLPSANRIKRYWACLFSSRIYKNNIQIEHFINIIIHSSVCLSIYFAFGNNMISFLAALLFSVNPTNNQVSIWMNGKRYGISALLVVLSLLYKPFLFFLFGFATLFQISAILAPVLYIYLGYWWVLLIAPLICFGLMYTKGSLGSTQHLMYELKLRIERNNNKEQMELKPKKLILFIKTIGKYFTHSLLPIRVSFFDPFMESFGLTNFDNEYWYKINKDFWIGIGVLATTIPLILFNYNNYIGLGLFWYILFISQWCHFPITVNQSFADRYAYLPNVGLMVAISTALMTWFNPILAFALFVAFLTYYATILSLSMNMYKNMDFFLHFNQYQFPDQFRVSHLMIRKHIKLHQWCHGIKVCADALMYRPYDAIINYYMGVCLKQLRYYEAANYHFKIALSNLPSGQENNFKPHIEKEIVVLPPRPTENITAQVKQNG